jgi:hypothetical protein
LGQNTIIILSSRVTIRRPASKRGYSGMDEKQIDVIGLGASTVDLLTLVEHFSKG